MILALAFVVAAIAVWALWDQFIAWPHRMRELDELLNTIRRPDDTEDQPHG